MVQQRMETRKVFSLDPRQELCQSISDYFHTYFSFIHLFPHFTCQRNSYGVPTMSWAPESIIRKTVMGGLDSRAHRTNQFFFFFFLELTNSKETRVRGDLNPKGGAVVV